MTTNFAELKIRIEILEKLDDMLKSIERETKTEWGVVSKTVTDVQDTHWKTGELLWEDDAKTVPKYKVDTEWDYIPKTELDEDDKIRLAQIDSIRKALLKMV